MSIKNRVSYQIYNLLVIDRSALAERQISRVETLGRVASQGQIVDVYAEPLLRIGVGDGQEDGEDSGLGRCRSRQLLRTSLARRHRGVLCARQEWESSLLG